jgi:hypothetical protein
MQVDLLKSEGDPPMLGFTNDPSWMVLPADLAPWQPHAGAMMPLGLPTAPDEIRAATEERGFYVTRAGNAA